jgi:hypothetical protein
MQCCLYLHIPFVEQNNWMFLCEYKVFYIYFYFKKFRQKSKKQFKASDKNTKQALILKCLVFKSEKQLLNIRFKDELLDKLNESKTIKVLVTKSNLFCMDFPIRLSENELKTAAYLSALHCNLRLFKVNLRSLNCTF